MKVQKRNRYLDFLMEPSFQEVSRHFALLFENTIDRTSYKNYCFPQAEINNYNVMNDEISRR